MHPHPQPIRRRTAAHASALLLALALAAPGAAGAKDMTFSAGSLIIPASIEYQSDTGILATYSLAYITLVKNGTRSNPITLYWAVQPKKRTQYHCDTGTDALPDYNTWNDNDGCDFYVQNAGGQPVSLVSPAFTIPTGSNAAFSISYVQYTPTTGPCRAGDPSCPSHAPLTIDASRKVVKYLGGAWIVDASQAQAFLDMLRDTATYPELAHFHANGPGWTMNGTSWYVNIHSANAAFTAPVVSQLTTQPPRIALLSQDTGDSKELPNILQNAGLCASSLSPGLANCGVNVPSPPPASFTHGVVYDWYSNGKTAAQNAVDLLGADPANGYAQGRINDATLGYGILWAGNTAFCSQNSTCPVISQAADQLANLTTFLNVKVHTLFAEYMSIGSIENGAFYQTTGSSGVTPVSQSAGLDTYEDCSDDRLPPGSKFRGNGGICINYGGSNQPYAQTGNFLYSNGVGSYEAYYPTIQSPTPAWNHATTQVLQVYDPSSPPLYTVASAINKDGSPNKALVVYLAGHKYDNDRNWGQRLVLNSIFANTHPPTPPEFARSEPVGYTNTVGTTVTNRVYQGTFIPMPGPADNDVITFDPNRPEVWQFPYTVGHLYEYDIANLSTSTTAQTFGSTTNSSAADWDAATVLAAMSPGSRVVFTYVGRNPGTSAPYLGSAHLGWKKVYFYKDEFGTAHDETAAACTDANADGLCDLSQLLAATNTAQLDGPLPTGARTAQQATDAQHMKMFLMQVLGYCASHTPAFTGTPNFTPSDVAQCDVPYDPLTGTGQTNTPALGGIDHSTPAVVGPSRYVTQTPYDTRPVIAYAGAADGMLHAFYVSGPTGWSDGEGRTLPAGVVPGQEIWAFVPPGQVGELGFNNGFVDGSINVVDVLGDFPYDANHDGVIDWSSSTHDAVSGAGERPNHYRRWRTVLTATVGPVGGRFSGSEIFALDVTDPLNPVLLWHLSGLVEHDQRWETASSGTFGSTMSTLDPTTYALKWLDQDTTDYNTTDATIVNGMKCGRFDYSNMGSAYSTAVAKVWVGGSYQYLLFVATNAAQWSGTENATACGGTGVSRGAEIFAVDLVTGQKQWQWEHSYVLDGTAYGIDNSIPPRIALGDIDANGSTDRIYLGDMAGHLWEIRARDGRNVNFMPDRSGVWHSLPLYGTPAMVATGTTMDAAYQVSGGSMSQQPITTPIGQGRFTAVPATVNAAMFAGRLSLLIGTMGVGWQVTPYEAGHIFVVPISPDLGTRLLPPIDLAGSSDPRRFGVIKQPGAVWDIPLDTKERVFGMPRVVNNTILFNTAYVGSNYADLTTNLTTSASDPGRLWVVSSAGAAPASNDAKSFGGVLVFADSVVITTDKSIHKMGSPPAAVTTDAGISVQPFNRATPAVMKTWEIAPR